MKKGTVLRALAVRKLKFRGKEVFAVLQPPKGILGILEYRIQDLEVRLLRRNISWSILLRRNISWSINGQGVGLTRTYRSAQAALDAWSAAASVVYGAVESAGGM